MYIFSTLSLFCLSFSLTAAQISRLYSIMPSARYHLVQLSGDTNLVDSFSYAHLCKALDDDKCKSADIDSSDIDGYLKSVYPFGEFSLDERSQFSRLFLKSVALEKEHSSTHYGFFHGTRATKFILLRTLLEQARQKREYQDFFLLRNKGKLDHLKGVTSGYQYAINKITSLYKSEKGLGRFDEPISSDLLSVNTAIFAHAKAGNNEDSISFLDKATRCGPAELDQKIEECLKGHDIDDLPKRLRSFLYEPMGSLLLVFIPRPLASLAYISYPFGIPVGLPQCDLLFGDISRQEAQEVIQRHEEYPSTEFFTQRDAFHQARILLNPDYFEENRGDVKMYLFAWEKPETMGRLQENFSAIISKVKNQIDK